MQSAAQRIAHYNARMQSSLLDPVLSAVSAQQQANFAAYAIDFYPFQTLLRAWLNSEGISVLDYFRWEACNGECYRAYRSTAGAAAVAEFTAIQVKYIDMGLLAADIKAMMTAVWSVVIP
jgi:hypothetical protein